jgi:hypothetical protein
MRHVAVMTATGAIGLMAVFVVDLLSLFWVSKLGDQAFKAAVGYAGLMTFFIMSINIGLTIAASATVSRALGAGDRPRARRLAASLSWLTAVFRVMAGAMFRCAIGSSHLFCDARESAEVASSSSPSAFRQRRSVGMTFSGSYARSAMRAERCTDAVGLDCYGVSIAVIFGLGLASGAPGRRSCLVWILLGVGWLGAVGVHDLRAAKPNRGARRFRSRPWRSDLPDHGQYVAPVSRPIRSGSSDFKPAIAASAVIDRVTPVAFGVLSPSLHRSGHHRSELWRETDGKCSG